MEEETKYRVEDPDQVEDEMPGIMKPLPSGPETRRKRGKRPVPIVKFFGVTMKETNRDNLLLIMIPLLVALIDANIFSWIIVGILEESSVYMFVIPLFAAIPVGLLMANTGRAIGGAVLTAIFFTVLIVGFIALNHGIHLHGGFRIVVRKYSWNVASRVLMKHTYLVRNRRNPS